MGWTLKEAFEENFKDWMFWTVQKIFLTHAFNSNMLIYSEKKEKVLTEKIFLTHAFNSNMLIYSEKKEKVLRKRSLCKKSILLFFYIKYSKSSYCETTCLHYCPPRSWARGRTQGPRRRGSGPPTGTGAGTNPTTARICPPSPRRRLSFSVTIRWDKGLIALQNETTL